jgi:putative ABC transport system substrate-binding protein
MRRASSSRCSAARPLGRLRRAQQLERVPRIGALLPYRETDTEAQGQMAAFRDELQQLELQNVRIDERWAGGDSGKLRAAAIDLVRLKSDVIITRSTAATTVLLSETRTIAVVFLVISDPVGDGFVFSNARPAGNATGFTDVNASVGGTWFQLVKEIAPQISRVAVLFGSGTAPGAGSFYVRSVEAAAGSVNVRVMTIRVNNTTDIVQDLRGFAKELPPAWQGVNGGIVQKIRSPIQKFTSYRS